MDAGPRNTSVNENTGSVFFSVDSPPQGRVSHVHYMTFIFQLPISPYDRSAANWLLLAGSLTYIILFDERSSRSFPLQKEK